MVVFVEIWEDFVAGWRLMEVQLRVILREKSLELILRVRALHAFLELVFILCFIPQHKVLVFFEIAVLQDRVILLEEVWLSV